MSDSSPSLLTRPASPRRRQRRARLLGWTGGAVVAILVVLVVTDSFPFPRPAGPRLAAGAVTGSTRRAGARSAEATRALTPSEPLRLWIGGDSLAGSLGPALGQMTADTGVVQPQFDSRVSSGLTDPGFFDWPAEAAAQMRLLEPDAAVFIVDTNDTGIVGSAPNAQGSWSDRYAALVDAMARILTSGGRDVYWLGAPVMKDQTLNKGVIQLNAVARQTVARFPTITYVDTYSLFADAHGAYTSKLPDATGKLVAVRTGDGIHLSPDGADRLARAVYTLMDQTWRIDDQAVPGRPKTVIETEGSTLKSGTYRTPTRSHVSGSSGSSRSSGSGSGSRPAGGSTSTTGAARDGSSGATGSAGSTTTTARVDATTPTSSPGGATTTTVASTGISPTTSPSAPPAAGGPAASSPPPTLPGT